MIMKVEIGSIFFILNFTRQCNNRLHQKSSTDLHCEFSLEAADART